jgi:hypothetical protein
MRQDVQKACKESENVVKTEGKRSPQIKKSKGMKKITNSMEQRPS